MVNVSSFLVDWTIRFLENKDAIRKEIVNIEKNVSGFDFTVHYMDKVKYFIIVSILVDRLFNEIKNEDYIGFITLNNLSNIGFTVSNWKRLIGFKSLNIFFVNPFSSLNKVWTINPYTHDKICDKTSLELGLKSIAQEVESIGMEELNNKIKLLKEESAL